MEEPGATSATTTIAEVIKIEIDDKDMHAITVKESNSVEIISEADKNFFDGHEIKVETIQIINP